jgi:hypothetical protein
MGCVTVINWIGWFACIFGVVTTPGARRFFTGWLQAETCALPWRLRFSNDVPCGTYKDPNRLGGVLINCLSEGSTASAGMQCWADRNSGVGSAAASGQGHHQRVGPTSCDLTEMCVWLFSAYLCLKVGGSEPPRAAKPCALVSRSAQYACPYGACTDVMGHSGLS